MKLKLTLILLLSAATSMLAQEYDDIIANIRRLDRTINRNLSQTGEYDLIISVTT